MKNSTKTIILFVVCVFSFFVNLGVFEPDIMEARNFVTAREMLQNHQWLIPTMNGDPRLEKPPFPTWLSAATMYFFGPSLFWLRVPACLMACLLLFFFYHFAKTLLGTEHDAWIGSLVLATSPLFIEMGRTGSWDIFCQALMMGAVFYLYKAMQSTRGGHRNFLPAGVLIGLSSMSKGPVAIYGMLLPFLAAYFIVFGFSSLKGRRKEIVVTIILALALSVWWYLYAKFEAPVVSAHVAEKEIAAWAGRHRQPFWFYLSFPVFMGIWAIFVVFSGFYPYLKKRIQNPQLYTFMLFWVLISVFLLSIVPEKKERYLLPVIPPMAILTGMMLQYIRKALNDPGEKMKAEQVIFKIFGILLMIAFSAGIAALYFVFYKKEYISVWIAITGAMAFFFMSRLAFMFLQNNRLDKMIGLVVGATMVITGLVLPGVPPLIYKNPEFKNIAEIKARDWYDRYDFYTDQELNIKAIWRVGKPVKVIENKAMLPQATFVLISENRPEKALGKEALQNVNITDLGNYDYYVKKSDFRLYVNKIEKK